MRHRAYSRAGQMVHLLALLLLFFVAALPAGECLAVDFSDDFDDNIKNKGLWGPDILYGIGQLKEKNQHLEYVLSSPNAGDYILRPLYGGVGPYAADWETRIDLYNGTNPGSTRYSAFGISIIRCGKPKNELYAEIYAWGGHGKGFYTTLYANNVRKGWVDTDDLLLNPLVGALRLAFNSITKVFTVYYSVSGGLETPLGSFSVDGSLGGANGDGNWGMDNTTDFCIAVYGYANGIAVGSGKLYGDNFSATGVTPDRVILLQPNGGDVIAAGSTSLIEWIAPPDAQTFKLQLSVDNGTTWSLIADPVPGPTSYSWTVPVPSNNKKQCLVKMTAFDGNDAKVGSDKSDSPFTIEVLKLTSPNGGEALTSNSTHTITWTNNGPQADQVILSFTLNNGNTWKTIEMGLDPADDGTFDWQVPIVNGTKEKCKVKIVLKDASGKTVGSDVSDETFTISP